MPSPTTLTTLAALSLVACAAGPVAPPPPKSTPTAEASPVDQTREVEIKQTHDQSLLATGRRAWAGYFRGAERLGAARAAELLLKVKRTLEAKGFSLTEDRAKAHVDVSLYPFRRDDTNESGVTLVAYVNAYGTRPRKWFEQTARMHAGFAEVWDTFATRVADGFAAADLKAPSADQKMKGDPGCVPRFGFQDEEITEGGQSRYKVARILPKSPATRAGLRLGDVLEAIDSRPYAAFIDDDQGVYESRVSVPVRLTRDGRVVRTTITSAISCGY